MMNNELTHLVTGMQHIGIPTTDMEKTTNFYNAIGFTEIYRNILENPYQEVRFFKLGNIVVEAYSVQQPGQFNGAIDHIALNVTNIEMAYETITRQGFIPLEKTIQYLPFFKAGVRFFTIMGSNGEKIEFNQQMD